MIDRLSNFFFEQKPIYQVFIIVALGLLFYFPFLGAVHLFDWDEINFAESAREMIVTGDYFRVQIDYQPFWEKPPLFFWLQSLAMHVFGINEFAARLPNAVFGIVTLLTFYTIGKKMYDKTFGIIWVLLYIGSFLPHLYFKSGIIDPVFNYFIFVSIYFLFRCIKQYQQAAPSIRYAFLAGLFNGLAILTKGPVGLLILILTFLIFWISIGFRKVASIKNMLTFIVTILLVTFLWYGFETIRHGPSFLLKFIQYQIALFSQPVAGHEQPFYYHFVVVLLGCFPLSIFAIGFFFAGRKVAKSGFEKWMVFLFWVVMILFSIVTTKIVHYSSMAYPPLAFLGAVYLHRLLNKEIVLQQYIRYLLLVFGIIFSVLLTLLPVIMYQKEHLYPYIKDPFAVACLAVDVNWNGYEFIIGIVYLLLVIFAFLIFKSESLKKAFVIICCSTALCMLFYTAIVVPKIEGHSQRSAVNFYKQLSGQDVYIITVGFKSYAHYFYARRPAGQRPERNDLQWLLLGKIDKPAYFVIKIQDKEKMDQYKSLQWLDTKGGFVFYRREPD